MSKLKKVLLMCTAYLLVAALAIGGTIAYLQDSDSDVNVMTLGNVKIEQHEYQRADGVAYDAGEPGAGNGVKEGDLVPFVQGQALYPAVPKNNAGGDYTAEMDIAKLFYWGDYVYSGTAGNGLWNDSKLSNVMDKMVFVENTGKSDAYVRTVIAFECPEGITIGEPSQGAEIMINTNGGTYTWEDVGFITVGGVRYAVMTATYKKVLAPGNQSHPSLLQVVMTHHATNEDMKLLGSTYEILVVSQAVQTAGFADAETALNAGFGDITVDNHPWSTNAPVIPVIVATADELSEALVAGKDVVLTDDVVLTETVSIPANANITLNLNGNDITGTFANPVSLITNNGDLTIEGEGEISVSFNGTVNNGVAMNAISNRGNLTINGGTISNTGTGNQIGYALDNYNGSSLTINGGKITASGSTYYDAIRLFCGSNETVVTVNGGEISSIWAQNPSANKATEVKGTVVVNGGKVTTVYYENYTTVKVADGVTTTVTPYGVGSDSTTSTSVGGYTVYSFVH